ncbi:uncharacterized protein LOC125488063 isoform X12 [Rhincodon typus]|uniref:uncharacterized protein LOC125488063 isoform X12 n=1 Tax=Rhincodon typus TaxID=259920 RepID=UPI002030853E|nr:uncharacterized protein LOC125488063 isoform X12 [Rhincodon typus]
MQVLTGNLIKSQITASLAFSQEINSIVICNSVLVISFQTLSMSEMSIKSTDQVGSTSGIPLKNPDPIGSKSGISIKIPDQIGSKSGISIKIPDQIGSKSGISFGRPDQIGSKSRISLQRPDQIGSKSGISLKRPDQVRISSKSGISLKRPDQLPEFRNVSTLYLETVEEEDHRDNDWNHSGGVRYSPEFHGNLHLCCFNGDSVVDRSFVYRSRITGGGHYKHSEYQPFGAIDDSLLPLGIVLPGIHHCLYHFIPSLFSPHSEARCQEIPRAVPTSTLNVTIGRSWNFASGRSWNDQFSARN